MLPKISTHAVTDVQSPLGSEWLGRAAGAISPVLTALLLGTLAMPATALAEPLPAVDCVINPYRVVDLASPVPGVIDALAVERSDPVVKGQVIAELAAGVEKATVALARSRAAIQSELEVGQVNLAFDQRRKKRIDALYQRKAVAFERMEEADRELELSTWKLEQARELMEIRAIELHRAEEQLKQKTITAPIDGFVLETYKSSGEYVEDQPIVRIAQLDPLAVEAIVPMAFHGQVQVGMSVAVYPEVLASGVLTGEVVVVDRMGDAASGTFGVRIRLPNPDNRLPAGLKCELKFNAASVGGELAAITTVR